MLIRGESERTCRFDPRCFAATRRASIAAAVNVMLPFVCRIALSSDSLCWQSSDDAGSVNLVAYVSVDGRLVVLSAIRLGSPPADLKNPTRERRFE